MTQPSSLHLSSPQPTRVHIPPELFEPIISHVAERSLLLSLCLTNQLLRYSAGKQLYSIVADLENRDLQIKFLTVITQTPRLALYVKEYRSYSIISSSGDPALRELTHDGLVAMKGLKVLIFREGSGQPCAEILDMDNGVAFQLIKLHWGSHSDENSMRKVLVQQGRTLRELYLQSRSGTLFPLAACPHLDYLSGNYHTIEALLSGRHVTRLRWVPDLFDPFSHFGKLEDVKKELDQIRTLHLGGYFGRPHLKCLSGYFSKLEALELVGLYDAEVLALDFTNSKWIWTNEVNSAGNAPAGSRAFRRDFYSSQGKTALSANIIITSDNGYTLWVNGNAVGSGHNFHQADAYCIRLAPDCNVFAVNATNDLTIPNPAGLLATIQIRYTDGFTDTIITDGTWHAFTSVPSGFQFSDFNDESWPAATVQGNYGIGPWNAVAIPPSASTTPLALADSNWIGQMRAFRKSISLPQGRRVTSATVLLRVDDAYTLYVQGRVVGSGTNWQATQRYVVDIQPPASDFTIALYGANNGGPAGIAAAVELKMEDCECGSIISFVTDSSWKYSTNTTAGFQNPGFDDSKWSNAIVESQYKTASWGNTPAPTKLTPPSAALAGAPAANAAIVVT
ncbi:hypothetical protein CPB84DRAFT_1848796 [Gymnopilus junonius]|uniref:Uncharacterized protein n=1 Tax=Gymnopilus junonius TaxID=109634 RepID=A0A9P5NJK2_GYMJU|nr:hypothetical protein CPB84DRAFT_1848796 [Gymnopilus junonius]